MTCFIPKWLTNFKFMTMFTLNNVLYPQKANYKTFNLAKLFFKIMVRSYKPKKPKDANKADKIKLATDLLKEGMSMRQACQSAGISRTVVYRWLQSKKQNKPLKTRAGNPTSLPEECERELNVLLTLKSKWGFACTRQEVKELVCDFVTEVKELDTEHARYIRMSL